MHIHILGICGTFMAGLALLARQQGHRVTGCDRQVYPPMSTQLQEQGIALIEGYDPKQLEPHPDLVVIGNAMSRGNPCVEYALDHQLSYISGPQFLAEHILKDRHVLAVAGTHGKTTTSSMLAWILEHTGHDTGFLIGGVPQNFGVSARLGSSPFFVIEADEYDSAFFDKRSKFIHYRPHILVINNLEFDHADIFDSLADIQKQFHYLIRTVPATGCICYPQTEAILQLIEQGCWSQVQRVASDAWSIQIDDQVGHQLTLFEQEQAQGTIHWPLLGQHNADNALMACLAAYQIGIPIADACEVLAHFQPPKRRLELLLEYQDIKVYDDFAHHPTAIETTLKSVRKSLKEGRLIAVFEPRSATMKRGVHQDALAQALATADQCFLYQAQDLNWNLAQMMQQESAEYYVFTDVEQLAQDLLLQLLPHDVVVIMSNGSFDGLHQTIVEGIKQR